MIIRKHPTLHTAQQLITLSDSYLSNPFLGSISQLDRHSQLATSGKQEIGMSCSRSEMPSVIERNQRSPKLSHDLQLLHSILELESAPSVPENLRDVVLVAIDFEGLQNIQKDAAPHLKSELGVAIPDTRGLSPQTRITTHNFIAGTIENYFECASLKFLFGNAERILAQNMAAKLMSCFHRAGTSCSLAIVFGVI